MKMTTNIIINGITGEQTVVEIPDDTPDPTEQELFDEASIQVRTRRNELLAASDWTQVADAPVDQAAWATYRQALRDITSQVGFPHDVVWPEKPQ